MDFHWRFILYTHVALVTAWIVTAVIGVSTFKERKWYRAFACDEGLGLAVTGIFHFALVFVLPIYELLAGPWDQSLLKCFLGVSVAWETSHLLMTLLWGWKVHRGCDFAFQCFHHSSGASLTCLAIVLEVPLIVHWYTHFVVAQHAWFGVYRFYSWSFSSAAWHTKWRKRVAYTSLSHDVSKMVVGLLVMVTWLQGKERRWDYDVLAVFNVILGSIVMLFAMDKTLAFPKECEAPAAAPSPAVAGQPETKALAPIAEQQHEEIKESTPATVEPKPIQDEHIENNKILEHPSKEDKISVKTPAASEVQREKVRVDTTAVTGLRGIACFHIALGHAIYGWNGECDPNCDPDMALEQKRWDLFGGVAVGLFYTISGFVLTVGYGQRKHKLSADSGLRNFLNRLVRKVMGIPASVVSADDAQDLKKFDARDFFKKRVLRVSTLYYLTNLIVLILWMVDGSFKTMTEERGIAFVVVRLLLGLFGLTSWSAWYALLPPNSVTWSISTMLFFYAMFPVFLEHLQRLPTRWLIPSMVRLYIVRVPMYLVGLTAAYLMGGTPADSYWAARTFPPVAFPVFGMGCCCAFLVLDDIAKAKAGDVKASSWLSLNRANTTCSLLLLGCLACTLFRRFVSVKLGNALRPEMEMLTPIFFPFVIRSLCAGSQQATLAARILRSRPLQFLGNISMSFYMIHYPVQMWFSWASGHDHKGQTPLLPGWGVLASLSTSLVLGWLLARYVEDLATRLVARPPPPEVKSSAKARKCDITAEDSGEVAIKLEN